MLCVEKTRGAWPLWLGWASPARERLDAEPGAAAGAGLGLLGVTLCPQLLGGEKQARS